MKTSSRFLLIMLCFLLMFSGIGASGPTIFASNTESINPAPETYINISVKNIKIHAPSTEPDRTHEFRFFIVASDKLGNSVRFACPGNTYVTARQGDLLYPCKYFVLSFKEREAPDQVHLLLLGVDEDPGSGFVDITTEAILAGLSFGLGKAVGAAIPALATHPAGAGAILVGIGLDAIISFIGGKVKDWLLNQDEIGSQIIVLERSKNWYIQKDTAILTSDKGMTVTLTIERSSTAPSVPAPTQSPKKTPPSPSYATRTPAQKVPPTSRTKPILINNIEYPTWKYCSNTRLSIIQVGDFAYVNPVPPLKNRLRKSPDSGSTILTMIPYGDRYRMEIQNGPECADGWIWWYVRYKDSNAKTWYGWTAEGDDYWLLPILEER